MQIYNTLTKRKEEFKSIEPSKITMYVCGPTVYDYFHIGNARTFIMTDVIRRYFGYKGYDVTYAMNLTDVDDKIIKKSNEEGITPDDVADKFIDAFFEDIEKLKVKKANIYPKATKHMGDIIKLIKDLEDKGFAYNVDGNVFYNVKKFEGYGKLSGKNVDDLLSGARIEINNEKDNPLDFALWKKAKDGEPSWDSPWGKGRPGWHIECSAMSMKHLGETIDIHAGGNDLVFPHHENEIAQSEACTSKQFVNYWMHFGFLNIKDEKMSKSLGNFFTARDILKQYSAEVIRLFLCQTHYAGPLNFSEEGLKSTENGLKKITLLAEEVLKGLDNSEGVKPEFDFDSLYASFETAMDDDFNSSRGVAVIFDFVKAVNKVIAENENISPEFFEKAKLFLEKTAVGVFGILDFNSISISSGGSLENELVELFIKMRTDAKTEKNWALADKIRDELKEIGIELKDSKTGTTFKKI
ncbi:MAG: cysteine--tRNA ligase [Melioribacteraceae bacterium]|nr:cysteine--tRNA ligase [Melioribacteraceae bacterium]